MEDIEPAVVAHYGAPGLFDRVLAGLAAMAVDPARVTAADLAGVDQFHTGGTVATEHLFAAFDLPAGSRLLDLGAGLGGTSRWAAEHRGAQVTGVDLTPEFVATASRLSALTGLSDRTAFLEGSALDLPSGDASFDAVVLMHVGMNVADKPRLFAEAARVLRPGGRFAAFEVTAGPAGPPDVFPLPWAATAAASFVEPPEAYVAAAGAAGLTLAVQEDRTAFGHAFMAAALARASEHGPLPLGLHLLMGPTAPRKFANYLANMDAGRMTLTEFVFLKPPA